MEADLQEGGSVSIGSVDLCCDCLFVAVCASMCERSYLLWPAAAGASEEARPFLPVPFTRSQHI